MTKQIIWPNGIVRMAAVLVLTVLASGLHCPALTFAAGEVTLSMAVPQQDYFNTYFGEEASYQVTVNGEEKTFKGVPYLYADYTYIPMRDLSEAFGIRVDYDQRDRSITLATNDKCIILASTSLSREGFVVLNHDGNYIGTTELFSYTMRGGVAYIPLRFVSEMFGLKVDYQEGRAIVSGNYLGPVGDRAWFGEDQLLVIEAAKNTEGAKQISAQVADEELGNYTAMVTRDFTCEDHFVEETTYVTDAGGDKYVGYRAASVYSFSRNLAKELPNGNREMVDLGRGAMGYHSYNIVGMTALEGVYKYRELGIDTVSRTDTEVIYHVTYAEHGWDERQALELNIDLATKTITKYVVSESKTIHYSDYEL